MADWGLYSALMGGDQKGYWATKRQDRMQSLMLMEKQVMLSEQNLKTEMEFEEKMQSYFDKINELDLLSEDQDRINAIEFEKRRDIYKSIAAHNGNLKAFMSSGGIGQLGEYRNAILRSKEAKQAGLNKQMLGEFLADKKQGLIDAPVTIAVPVIKDGKIQKDANGQPITKMEQMTFEKQYALFKKGIITSLSYNGAIKPIDIKPLDFAKQSKNPANPLESAPVTAQDVKFKSMAAGNPEWYANQQAQQYVEMYKQTGTPWHWNTDADNLLKMAKYKYWSNKGGSGGKSGSSKTMIMDAWRTKVSTLQEGEQVRFSAQEQGAIAKQLGFRDLDVDDASMGGRYKWDGKGYGLTSGEEVNLFSGEIRNIEYGTVKEVNGKKQRGVVATVAFDDDDTDNNVSQGYMEQNIREALKGDFWEEDRYNNLWFQNEVVGTVFIPFDELLEDPNIVANMSRDIGIKNDMLVTPPSYTDESVNQKYWGDEAQLISLLAQERGISEQEAYDLLHSEEY